MQNETKTASNAAKLAVIASSALLLAGAGCSTAEQAAVQTESMNDEKPAAMEPKQDDGDNDGADVAANVNASVNVNVATPGMGTVHYKDGTYNVTGHYTSPAGPETIKVSITLKGDVIVDSTVTPQATNKISVMKQNAFAGGYKAQVIGKNINEVNLLSAIAGSSLTPKGFNEAIVQVKAEAKI